MKLSCHKFLFLNILCDKMSCYKYWGTIEEIANKLSSYGDLDTEGISALDGTDIEEITKILDDIEVIAHDKEIDFDWIHSIFMTGILALLKMRCNWLNSMKTRLLYS